MACGQNPVYLKRLSVIPLRVKNIIFIFVLLFAERFLTPQCFVTSITQKTFFVFCLTSALLSFSLLLQYEREQTLAVLQSVRLYNIHRIIPMDYNWNLFNFCKSAYCSVVIFLLFFTFSYYLLYFFYIPRKAFWIICPSFLKFIIWG